MEHMAMLSPLDPFIFYRVHYSKTQARWIQDVTLLITIRLVTRSSQAHLHAYGIHVVRCHEQCWDYHLCSLSYSLETPTEGTTICVV